MEYLDLSNVGDTIERMLHVIRTRPDDLRQALQALAGESPDWPDFAYVYPTERRTKLLDQLAATVGLSRKELLLIPSIFQASAEVDRDL